jgi:hypothetical protein
VDRLANSTEVGEEPVAELQEKLHVRSQNVIPDDAIDLG